MENMAAWLVGAGFGIEISYNPEEGEWEARAYRDLEDGRQFLCVSPTWVGGQSQTRILGRGNDPNEAWENLTKDIRHWAAQDRLYCAGEDVAATAP